MLFGRHLSAFQNAAGKRSVFFPFVFLFLSIFLIGSTNAQNREDRRQISLIEEYCLGCHNFEDYAGQPGS